MLGVRYVHTLNMYSSLCCVCCLRTVLISWNVGGLRHGLMNCQYMTLCMYCFVFRVDTVVAWWLDMYIQWSLTVGCNLHVRCICGSFATYPITNAYSCGCGGGVICEWHLVFVPQWNIWFQHKVEASLKCGKHNGQIEASPGKRVAACETADRTMALPDLTFWVLHSICLSLKCFRTWCGMRTW